MNEDKLVALRVGAGAALTSLAIAWLGTRVGHSGLRRVVLINDALAGTAPGEAHERRASIRDRAGLSGRTAKARHWFTAITIGFVGSGLFAMGSGLL